jgi:hypothetical protein
MLSPRRQGRRAATLSSGAAASRLRNPPRSGTRARVKLSKGRAPARGPNRTAFLEPLRPEAPLLVRSSWPCSARL